MELRNSLVVYTDLDGTLLDHETYSWQPARPALTRLAERGVPVVLASSKTAREISKLQRALGLEAFPAIVENGAGVLYPGTSERGSGADYAALREVLADISTDLRSCFEGFGDMDTETLMRITGLPRADAILAQDRQYSEPGLWSGTDVKRATFVAALSTSGVTAREGGRFMTLSFGKTKRDRMDEINLHFGAQTTIALGDAPNDIEMLDHATVGVIVRNPHRSPLPPLAGEAEGRITRTAASGPAGWNAAVSAFLDADHTQKGARGFG